MIGRVSPMSLDLTHFRGLERPPPAGDIGVSALEQGPIELYAGMLL